MSGIIGGLIGAIGQGISNISNRKHDRNMAALNQQYTQENMALQQEYNLATMAQQNQYQIDQWNRENEYNDPSAVAVRYRAAGINPRAAFGQGSASGAGIAGGLSSAPSGGAPSGTGPMGTAHPNSGVGQALSSMDVEGTLAGIYTALTDAKNTNADTEGKLIENRHKETSILLDLEQKRANILKTGVETDEKRSTIKLIDQQIEEANKRIESIDQQMKESKSRMSVNDSLINLNERKTFREKQESEFYQKYGFFPNQSWITSIATGAWNTGEKVVKSVDGGNDNQTSIFVSPLAHFLDSNAGQKFIEFLKNEPIKRMFQRFVYRNKNIEQNPRKEIARFIKLVNSDKEVQNILKQNRIPLKQFMEFLEK